MIELRVKRLKIQRIGFRARIRTYWPVLLSQDSFWRKRQFSLSKEKDSNTDAPAARCPAHPHTFTLMHWYFPRS